MALASNRGRHRSQRGRKVQQGINTLRYQAPASQSPLSTEETEFRAAVQRVYEKYGSDLAAFYRDVEKELALEKCERESRGSKSIIR